MVRAARAQRNHIGMAIRAFVRLEWHRLRTGVNGGRAKGATIRPAIRRYLAHLRYRPPATAYVLKIFVIRYQTRTESSNGNGPLPVERLRSVRTDPISLVRVR